MSRLRAAAPWCVAIVILAYLVAGTDHRQLRSALLGASLVHYLPLACLFIGAWLAIDARILAWLFSRLVGPVDWHEMVRLRGSTYLLMPLSFDLANAALVGLVRQRTGAPLARATATMLVHYAGDITALTAVAFAASLAADSPRLDVIRPILALAAASGVALLGAGRLLRSRWKERALIGALVDLDARDLLRLVGLRAGFYMSFVVFVWLTLPAFGIHLPIIEIAARMPVVMSIGALPITPVGLGTTQAAMVGLFGEIADPAKVLAYALVYGLTLLVVRLPIGFVFLRQVLRHRAADPM